MELLSNSIYHDCRGLGAGVAQQRDEVLGTVAKQAIGQTKTSCRVPNDVTEDVISDMATMNRAYPPEVNHMDEKQGKSGPLRKTAWS